MKQEIKRSTKPKLIFEKTIKNYKTSNEIELEWKALIFKYENIKNKAKKNQLYYAELYSTVYGTLNLIQENFWNSFYSLNEQCQYIIGYHQIEK